MRFVALNALDKVLKNSGIFVKWFRNYGPSPVEILLLPSLYAKVVRTSQIPLGGSLCSPAYSGFRGHKWKVQQQALTIKLPEENVNTSSVGLSHSRLDTKWSSLFPEVPPFPPSFYTIPVSLHAVRPQWKNCHACWHLLQFLLFFRPIRVALIWKVTSCSNHSRKVCTVYNITLPFYHS